MRCADCDADWDFGPGEREWFEGECLALPRRCKPCRARRREYRNSEPKIKGVVEYVRQDVGWGFITTAERERFYFAPNDVAKDAMPLRAGERVVFRMGDSSKGRHLRASLVHLDKGDPTTEVTP